MARTKGITKKTVAAPTKVDPIWQIGILFPNGQKIIKSKCTLNDLFYTYFLNLDNLISTCDTAEELFDKYKETFKAKDIKIQINYIDSWGHKWSGRVAWPKDEWFIEFLNKRFNENNS